MVKGRDVLFEVINEVFRLRDLKQWVWYVSSFVIVIGFRYMSCHI